MTLIDYFFSLLARFDYDWHGETIFFVDLSSKWKNQSINNNFIFNLRSFFVGSFQWIFVVIAALRAFFSLDNSLISFSYIACIVFVFSSVTVLVHYTLNTYINMYIYISRLNMFVGTHKNVEFFWAFFLLFLFLFARVMPQNAST